MAMTDEKAPRRLKPLGARHVATRVADRWQIERVGAGEGRDRLVTVAECGGSLPNRRRGEIVDGFLACGGAMAAFELHQGGTRKALGAKVIPYRATPVLVVQPLTADTDRHEFSRAHPVLARKEGLVRYHWDTPPYREICAEVGVDPDEGRPRYRAPYDGIAGDLERWVGEASTGNAALSSPRGEAEAAAFDVLDLVRADRLPDPELLDRLRRRWVRVDPGCMPRFGELDQLVNSEALLADGAASTHMPLAAVDFLPSRFGSGCCASVYGFHGTHEPDGWVAEDHAGLLGVAVEPDGDALREQAWLRTVVRRLRGQGVLFLTCTEARAYLAGNEASYWVWRGAGTFKWRDEVRAPSIAERVGWRVLPPDLPLDRALTRRLTAAKAG